jgi:hypothetical protein
VTVSGDDFTITGSRTGPQAFDFTYDPAGYAAVLSLNPPPPGGQIITVRVADSVRSQAGGLVLDGELPDAGRPSAEVLPSGDGLPGGPGVFTFFVAVPGDFDADYHVDEADVDHFLACRTGPDSGPPAPGCADADLDADLDVDQSDFGILQRCLAGPDPPDPNCG